MQHIEKFMSGYGWRSNDYYSKGIISGPLHDKLDKAVI